MDDAAVEQEIKDKGLSAPRVTKEQIDAIMETLVVKVTVVDGTTTTLAIAVMPNGFTVAVAESACASPANFDSELGKKLAVEKVLGKARNRLWMLEGYRLKMNLINGDT